MPINDDLQFFAATDVGRKRAHNEDNFLVDKDLQLFIVADGMGGHAAGEVASALAVRIMHQTMVANAEVLNNADADDDGSENLPKRISALLERGIKIASKAIHAEAQRDSAKRGMGTTMSALLICGSKGYIGHVGDSRIYLVRGGSAHQITEDHTIANELLRLGMVTPEQLENIPKKNAITRAVGVYEHVDVDTLSIEILPGDQFVLASDGFTGYLEDHDGDLCAMVADDDGEAIVTNMIDFANQLGGKDNVTTLLVRIGGRDGSEAHRAERIALTQEALSSMPLFCKLNKRELLQIMQVADVRRYQANETIILEGTSGEEMFLTLEGRLRVAKGPATLRELGRGDHFGEMALIRSTARSATVTAIEDSEVLSIRRSDFFDLIRSDTHVAVKLLWQFLGVLANRLEHTSHALSAAREELEDNDGRPQAAGEDEDPFSRPMFGVLETLRITSGDQLTTANNPPPTSTSCSEQVTPSTSPTPEPAEAPASEPTGAPPDLIDVRKTVRRIAPTTKLRKTLRSANVTSSQARKDETSLAEDDDESDNGQQETEDSLKKTTIKKGTGPTRKVGKQTKKGDQNGLSSSKDEATLLDRLRKEYRERLTEARNKRKKEESD